MASLTIPDLPEPLWRRLLDEAERHGRTPEAQVRAVLDEALPPPRTHSILELWGLGKEVWRGIDAVEYVRQERDSWHDGQP